MLDVFNEEDDALIKDGIANLYWFRDDLKHAWLKAGVQPTDVKKLFAMRDAEGRELTKRQLMGKLYERLRAADFNYRVKVSRNFVRFLVERTSFVAQSEKHDIRTAERSALKLRERISFQRREYENREVIRANAMNQEESYETARVRLLARFAEIMKLQPRERGIALEPFFTELARVSKIPVEEPFRIVGEQIDGALRHDGCYYLTKLRWRDEKANQQHIAGLYLKVEGKMGARGIFISMNGFSSEVVESLVRGKEVKVVLLEGRHIVNVLSGIYTLNELLAHAVRHASLFGAIFCPLEIPR